MFVRSSLVVSALAVVALQIPSPAAHAKTNVNPAFYGGYTQVSYNTDRHDGMVGIFDVSVKRGMAYKDYMDMICDYQAKATLTLPSGYSYEDESSFHHGCNGPEVPAYFTFRQYGSKSNHDEYPPGSVFRVFWRDKHTGGEYKQAWSMTLK